PLTAGLVSELEGAPPEVVIYLTQNSVKHHKDEVPESLAALKTADKGGMGAKSLLPISDPYSDGTETYKNAFSQGTEDMKWWQEDDSMGTGQVKIGEDVLTLGAQNQKPTDGDVAKIREDWRTLLIHVGLSKERSASVLEAMLTDSDGKAQLTASGAGASNELAQLIAVFDRAERGEFIISTIVLSGHHYSGDNHIFGEDDSHGYDDDILTGDTLNMKDIESLKGVFPKAFKQVKAVMFSACNTHDIGMSDDGGDLLSTNEWLESTFPSVEKSSYWEDTAPGSDMAAFFSGEFLLDLARESSGKDPKAFEDAYFRSTQSGDNIRSKRSEDGKLTEQSTKKNTDSYEYNDYKGLRDSNHEPFHEREDLMEYVAGEDGKSLSDGKLSEEERRD
ncbi:MAG: hypothetical protein ACI8RZ_007343, partial [Myxococcota bacterium]